MRWPFSPWRGRFGGAWWAWGGSLLVAWDAEIPAIRNPQSPHLLISSSTYLFISSSTPSRVSGPPTGVSRLPRPSGRFQATAELKDKLPWAYSSFLPIPQNYQKVKKNLLAEFPLLENCPHIEGEHPINQSSWKKQCHLNFNSKASSCEPVCSLFFLKF